MARPDAVYNDTEGRWVSPAGPVSIEAKTANYTVTDADRGKLFTNRGATGAVTFTLPAPSAALKGYSVEFLVVADQTVTITGTADKLVAFNDPVATSIAFATTGEKVGGYVRCICDGTSWLAIVGLGAEAQTPTVTA